MPEKPCQWCGTMLKPGWSDHRCPEMEAALDDLKAAAGVEDEPEHNDGCTPACSEHHTFEPPCEQAVPPRPVTDEDFAALPILDLQQFDGAE
jgi:hypothetical protein